MKMNPKKLVGTKLWSQIDSTVGIRVPIFTTRRIVILIFYVVIAFAIIAKLCPSVHAKRIG